jgi:phosphomannomutase
MTFEGAEGAAQIQALVASYAAQPHAKSSALLCRRRATFATERLFDSEGDEIPKEKMLMIDLADGRRVAVRPSGTEPKIKFYLFATAFAGCRRALHARRTWRNQAGRSGLRSTNFGLGRRLT